MNLFKSNSPSTLSSRPTICHVLHTLNVGGAEMLAKRFAMHSADRFRPVFVCLDSLGTLGRELRDSGFDVEVASRRPGFDIGCARTVARFFRNQNVKLVHAHQYGPFFYSCATRMIGTYCPILFTEHGRDYPDFRRIKRVLANKLLLGSCDRVIAVGDYVKQALIKNEGISEDRIEVIYNGVDCCKYDFRQRQREQVRAELGIGENEIAVVQVARLNRLKDFRTAIRAIANVCQVCPRVRYIVIGEGEERELIERWINEYGLRKRVTMLGLRHDVPRLLEGMDVFMLSSLTEGIPLTLVESMLAALPCVATGVGGIPEVVRDGISGMIAEANQPDDIAEKLLDLLRSPKTRKQMGARARQRAIRLFPADRMLASYDRLYAEMTRGPLPAQTIKKQNGKLETYRQDVSITSRLDTD